MKTEEAIALIISEAQANGEGVLARVRRGEDPETERMRQLNSALNIIFHALEGQNNLDRNLAAALFTLGSDVPLTISAWANKGHLWRRGLMEDEVYEMLMGVQSIFEDKGFASEQPETVH